jgi:hypothetical protein
MNMNVYRNLQLLTGFSVICLSVLTTQVNAQVFLGGNNSDNNAASSSTNEGATSSRNSFLMMERGDNNTVDRNQYFKDRVSRNQQPRNTRTGQTYSIQDYNRLLLEQRNAGTSANRTGDTRATNQYYPSSYLNRNVERVRKNPFTKRYATQAEIDRDVAAREAYYKKYPQLTPQKRNMAEERFFNSNGYYKDDADLVVSADGQLSERKFGSRVDLGAGQRATSQKYIDSANRFKNSD